MHLLLSGEPSQHHRHIRQRSRDGKLMESYTDDITYQQLGQDYISRMRSDDSELNHKMIGNRDTYPPFARTVNPDHVRRRVESWMESYPDPHGDVDERPPARKDTRFSLQKRRRMDAGCKKESLACISDELFYPHLNSPTESITVRKEQLYRSNFNFGQRTFDRNPIKAPTELTNGRINSSNCQKRKPFTPAQRPKTCLSTSSSAETFTFSESESSTSNQNSLDSFQSSLYLSPKSTISTSTGGEEVYRQPLKCNLFGKPGSKRTDHALYADQIYKDIRKDNCLKQDPQQSSISISSLFCSSASSTDNNKNNQASIQTTFHSAEGTGESEANSSGSAMAEHGHESEIGERNEDEKQREGDRPGRERRSGSGYGGGDDRQSSASTGLGKAGEDNDGR